MEKQLPEKDYQLISITWVIEEQNIQENLRLIRKPRKKQRKQSYGGKSDF